MLTSNMKTYMKQFGLRSCVLSHTATADTCADGVPLNTRKLNDTINTTPPQFQADKHIADEKYLEEIHTWIKRGKVYHVVENPP